MVNQSANLALSAASPDREKLSDLIEATIAQSRALAQENLPATLNDELLMRALKLISEANDLLSEQRAKINALQTMVTRDEMTGLLNRRGLEEQLARELGRIRRGQSRGCTLVLFDLDKFKSINDNYGHPAGDAAIRTVGEFFTRTVRETDAMARMGGDEFALVLTDIDHETAEARANRIASSLNNLSLSWDGVTIPLHGSFGLARHAGPDEKFEKLYRAADEALYRAKMHRK